MRLAGRMIRGPLVGRRGWGFICRRCAPSLSTAETSATASQADIERARAYCSNLLQKYDSPSYILQTFIPLSARDAYLAIRAFNVSIAMIADSVNNATVGAMRMEFWREAISKTYQGSPPKEPVTQLLAHALKKLEAHRGHLNKSWFLRVISTREQYLDNPPYPTLSSLETYAESTYSTLLYLTLSALPLHSVTADHLASHIGKATGIAAVLRGLPLVAFPAQQRTHTNPAGAAALGGGLLGINSAKPNNQGTVTLPLDVMAEAGLREEDVFRQGASAPGLKDAVFAVATRANDHLITAREMLKRIRAGQDVGHEFEHADDPGHRHAEERNQPASSVSSSLQSPLTSPPSDPRKEVDRSFGVLLPAVSTQLWLDRLQRADFDVFRPELRSRDWRLPWKAYWAFQRRRV